MPPSNRVKGRRTELKVKHWLEKQGYEVELAPIPTRWGGGQDFFDGLWDGIAHRSDEIMFFQVKSNRSSVYGKKLDRHRAWKTVARKAIFLWEPRKRLPEVIELGTGTLIPPKTS